MRFSLPRLSTQIPTLHRPSLPTFRSLLSSPTPQPVLLTGLIDHWPALTSWTIPNKLGKLREMAQGVLVPVEWARRGRGYLDEEDGERTGGKTTMLLETYLDAFVLDRIPWEEPGMEEELTFYMAQCDLIDKIPELKEDIPGPFLEPYLTEGGKGEVWPCNVWIGPRGTFTPIHRDPYHNLLTHLSPSPKTVHLYPPSTPPHTLFLAPPPQQQTSRIPVSPPNIAALPDVHRWAAFDEARKEERVVRLERGDTVLIPEGWWHCVEGVGDGREGEEDTVRIGVNFWFR